MTKLVTFLDILDRIASGFGCEHVVPNGSSANRVCIDVSPDERPGWIMYPDAESFSNKNLLIGFFAAKSLAKNRG